MILKALPSLAVLSMALSPGQLLATISIEQQPTHEVLIRNGSERLHITACHDDVIHIVAAPDDARASSPQQPWIQERCTPIPISLSETPKQALLRTSDLEIAVSLGNAALEFKDISGKSLLSEDARQPRQYNPIVANSERLYQVSDRFLPEADQGIYGLGQHQSGMFNYRGSVVELAQTNTDVAVPLFVSTSGYGLMWNAASRSWFDNRNMRELRLSSDAAHAIDYYFCYGPEVDQITHHYREMTGHAPLLSKWAYGFFQSKDRYTSAKQLIDVAHQYRSQHVPLDVVVQDWFWWSHQGDAEFSAKYLGPLPDVPKAIQDLHAEGVHTIISAWAVLDPKSHTYEQMKQRNLLIPGTTDYDPSSPEGRDLYWDSLIGKLFAQGWDGFWLDSSEPEGIEGVSDAILSEKQLAIGNGALYTNIFPLMHTGNIYDHWLKSGSDKRPFILTRSAFLGQQRYAAVTWSGDVFSTFLAFQRQVPAGLNFAVSGLPYWTTDIGGYSPSRDTRDSLYQELYTRWYEYGVFCPIFRTHGNRANNENEMFSYGPVTPILIEYDKLRYRLLPYLYSLAWKVCAEDYTIQRPLVMDWRKDQRVWNIGNQFMFGPSVLVNPVTAEGAKSRQVYLPPSAAWYDFWTGEKLSGGQQIEAAAPLDRIPLYIRAGAILPLGPQVEYASQQPDGPIEIRIYEGADGSFDLYADSGDGHEYEHGAHAIIPLRWDQSSHTLHIGARQGRYEGMGSELQFNVVLVSRGQGIGTSLAANKSTNMHYVGQAMQATLNP